MGKSLVRQDREGGTGLATLSGTSVGRYGSYGLTPREQLLSIRGDQAVKHRPHTRSSESLNRMMQIDRGVTDS